MVYYGFTGRIHILFLIVLPNYLKIYIKLNPLGYRYIDSMETISVVPGLYHIMVYEWIQII